MTKVVLRLGFGLLLLLTLCVGSVPADTVTVSVPERSAEIDFALERLERVLVARQISLTVSSGAQGRHLGSLCSQS